MNDWPDDAAGDVFRRLSERGFNFDREYEIDFNIEFDRQPLVAEVLASVKANFPQAKVSWDEGEDEVLVQLRSKLTYALVIKVQADLTRVAEPFRGWCECWGVLWNPNEAMNRT